MGLVRLLEKVVKLKQEKASISSTQDSVGNVQKVLLSFISLSLSLMSSLSLSSSTTTHSYLNWRGEGNYGYW